MPEGQAGLANEHWVVEPVACIVTGIDRCEAKPGQRIAIVGCGFMGLMIIQGLKGVGLNQLIALDVDDDRLAMAMEMGATETHNSAAEGFDEIKRDLATREIDCVVDSSGAQPGLDLATDIVKRAGMINLFGWMKGEEAIFDPSKWHGKAISVVNSSPAAQIRDPFPPAIRMIEQGIIDLKPLVTHTVTLDECKAVMLSRFVALTPR